jgi:hypothetical protein
MPDYKVLIVAPPNDLVMVDNEVQQVNNLLGAKLLQGDDADIRGVLNMIAHSFDIVWFATHGDENGVYLNDGIFPLSQITTLVRSVGASLLVLNTCSSKPVALGIYDELRIPVVCTLTKVPDRTAFFTGAIFARKLSEGWSYREAYEKAKPGQNSTYKFIPEEEREMAPPPERSNRIEDDITSLAALVRRLEILVTGNADYNVEGLTKTVKALSVKVDQLLVDFGAMRTNQMFNRRVLIFLTFLSISLLIAVAVLVYQRVTL